MAIAAPSISPASPSIPGQLAAADRSSSGQQLAELLHKGSELVEAGDYSRALRIYQQALSLVRDNPRIYSGIGYLQALQGNFQDAVRAYQQAVTLDPNNADFHYALAIVRTLLRRIFIIHYC